MYGGERDVVGKFKVGKFKVGDKVKIKTIDELDKVDEKWGIKPNGLKYYAIPVDYIKAVQGKVFTVCDVYSKAVDLIDSNGVKIWYRWHKDMLRPVNKEFNSLLVRVKEKAGDGA